MYGRQTQHKFAAPAVPPYLGANGTYLLHLACARTGVLKFMVVLSTKGGSFPQYLVSYPQFQVKNTKRTDSQNGTDPFAWALKGHAGVGGILPHGPIGLQ